MLPFQSASDMFQGQMRSRLGFGPSSPGQSGSPAGGESSWHAPALGVLPTGPARIGPNGPNGPYGGGSSTGMPDGPARIGPNGPNGPYGGGSSTGPLDGSTRNNGGSVLGGWNLGGSYNPSAPQAPKPFLDLSSLNNPGKGSSFDYGATANTAINGAVANPYGPLGHSQDTSRYGRGYLDPSVGVPGSMAYTPLSGGYGYPAYGVNAQMMPDQFANMNPNYGFYGSTTPYGYGG